MVTDTDNTDDRRRVLEAALDRRPDMSIADLHDALGAMGLDVPTDVLVSDLDALGFEVDPADAGGAADDAGPSFLPRSDASAGAIGEPQDDDVAPWWQGRTGVALLAAAVLVVALVVAFAVAGGGDDDDVADGGDTPAQTGGGGDTDTGAGAETTSTAPVPTAPRGPGEDEELSGEVDGATGFDDAGDGLGTAPDGTEWTIGTGAWSRSDGLATLTGVEGDDGIGLATFDPQLSAYRLQVRLGSMVAGNGLVFGASGPDDYFAFVAAPDYSTFVLGRVTDGELEIIDNSNLTSTVDGKAVIGVHVTPGQVEALVNGAVVITAELPEELPGTAIGLGSFPGPAGGTFDEVSYRVDP